MATPKNKSRRRPAGRIGGVSPPRFTYASTRKNAAGAYPRASEE